MITTHQKRLELSITLSVPKDQTPAETVDWIQRYLTFYHPSMAPAVVGKHPKVIDDEASLLGEEPMAAVASGEELL